MQGQRHDTRNCGDAGWEVRPGEDRTVPDVLAGTSQGDGEGGTVRDGRSLTRRRVVQQLLDWSCDPQHSAVDCIRGGPIGAPCRSWWRFEIMTWKGNHFFYYADTLAAGFRRISQHLDELNAKKPAVVE